MFFLHCRKILHSFSSRESIFQKEKKKKFSTHVDIRIAFFWTYLVHVSYFSILFLLICFYVYAPFWYCYLIIMSVICYLIPLLHEDWILFIPIKQFVARKLNDQNNSFVDKGHKWVCKSVGILVGILIGKERRWMIFLCLCVQTKISST